MMKEIFQTHSSQGVFSSVSKSKLKREQRRAFLQAIETQMQQVIIDSLSWLILKQKKARNGLLVDERIGIYRSLVAHCDAAGGGVLRLKLVSVVDLS